MAATAVTQLSIPGVLVLISAPDSGAPVADRVMWQRAVLQASLPSAAKLVALALCSHVDQAGSTAGSGHAVCAPGLAVLVSETGYSRTHVQRQLTALRNRGWLVAESRPAAGRPARFGLSLPAAVARAHGIRTESAPLPDEAAATLPQQPHEQLERGPHEPHGGGPRYRRARLDRRAAPRRVDAERAIAGIRS